MKLWLSVAVFIWLVCGLAGAWRLDELDKEHWKTVAKGPISLARAFNENPVTY